MTGAKQEQVPKDSANDQCVASGKSSVVEEGITSLNAATSLRQRHNSSSNGAGSSTPSGVGVDEEEQALTAQSNDEKKGEEEKDVEEDDVQENNLANTTFSLLFIADMNSKAYFYSLFIICFQITIVFAAVWDSLDRDNSTNPGNFPPGVDVSVSITQAAVLPLAVAGQNDFIEAIVRLNDRLTENVKIGLTSPTFAKWLISSVGQLTVGMGILSCIFLFTMQSETVFKVLVNFAALLMISNISSVAFTFANRGFCGEAIWKDTIKVTNHIVRRRHKNNRAIQLLYFLSVCVLYAGYGVVKHRQLSGYYLCNAIYVQYDDSYKLGLPLLSGVYLIENRNVKIASRFTYVDTVSESRLRMAYCSKDDAYGLSTHPKWVQFRNDTEANPCDVSVSSQTTDSFDITTTAHQPWRIFSERDNTQIDTDIIMQCVDCDSSSCQPDRGTCVNNKCVCKEGRYGVHCNFRAPCKTLVLDTSIGRGDFPPIRSIINQDYVVLARNYTLLKDEQNGTVAMAYNRPIYVSTGYEYVLLFTGRRWAIISPLLFFEHDQSFLVSSAEELKSFLLGASKVNLYDFLNNTFLQRFAVSEPVDSGSNIDQGSPIGLQWFGMRAVRNANQPIIALDRQIAFDARFICFFCEEGVNDCENFGYCHPDTKTCECTNETVGFPIYTGALCEKAVGCDEAQRDFGELLPSGCFGNYTCRADGTCDCLDLFPGSGTFCQFLPCYEETIQELFPPSGCANGGTCSNTTGSCVCETDVYEGKYCQDMVPPCFEREAQLLYPPGGCLNDGVCNNDTGFCDCDADFSKGRYCQTALRDCHDELILNVYPGGCANNGTCDESTGSCICPEDVFEGRYCEREVASCYNQTVQLVFEGGCANNGVCDDTTGACVCESSFFGKYCQKVNNTQAF